MKEMVSRERNKTSDFHEGEETFENNKAGNVDPSVDSLPA
jgi:hypothetical protein